MRVWISLLALSTSLAGCADPRAEELEESSKAVSDLAIQCSDDVKTVPAEHSMHCIEATKLVHPFHNRHEGEETLLEYCRDSTSKACDEYGLTLGRVQYVYWRAMSQSVANFGIPQDFVNERDKTSWYHLADLMRPYFEKCLEKHPDPPPPEPIKKQELRAGEIPVPVDPGTPIENEHCIGLGTNRPAAYP